MIFSQAREMLTPEDGAQAEWTEESTPSQSWAHDRHINAAELMLFAPAAHFFICSISIIHQVTFNKTRLAGCSA